MSDEHDLHEPEHDHLLDHEFLYEDFAPRPMPRVCWMRSRMTKARSMRAPSMTATTNTTILPGTMT